jgi:translocation and assembly module TamB
VRAWAARETAAILSRELGVTARYQVAVQAWPLMIGLDDVVVDASDGGSPFLEVEHVAVRPRPFSLLAGELDVGDVEIVGPASGRW